MTIPQFQKTILRWHKENRRDMPWRETKDPYKILVSEVMLQQTGIARVLPKYREFLCEFPTLKSLVEAPDRRVLGAWRGLGYWQRALNLKKAAKQIVHKMRRSSHLLQQGISGWKGFSTPQQLEKLPGIGPYTARAVACFAFGNCEPFLDTNIRRVYLHFFFKNKKNVPDKEILPIAQKVLNSIYGGRKKLSAREWHYALFDYGAIVLKDKKISRQSKHYAKQSKFKGSFRSFRTKVIRFLLDQPGQRASYNKLKKLLLKEQSPYSPEKIVASLQKDNLIKKKRRSYSL